MGETPAADGGVYHANSTLEEMFEHLRQNRDTRCVGIPYPALGVRILIRVHEHSPDEELLYDLVVLCTGDGEPDHEDHPVDGRQLQTRQEIEELLQNLHQQEQLHQLMQALTGGMADLN